jgi:hypothetical protein
MFLNIVNNFLTMVKSCEFVNNFLTMVKSCEFESCFNARCSQYVIKFVSDLRQVSGFLQELWFPHQ